MMMIRNIIWDVDGTLFDTYPAIARAFQAALAGLGKDAALDEIVPLAKQSLGFCSSTLAARYRLNEEDLGRAFGDHYERTKPGEQPAFPGAKKNCEYICSIGGKNVIVTHRGRKGTAGLLAANDMTRYFAGWITREDGYPRKPDPAAFEAALKAYGLRREETMTVGDRDIDVLAGNATGIFTCLFGTEGNGSAADLTVGSLEELYRHVISSKP